MYKRFYRFVGIIITLGFLLPWESFSQSSDTKYSCGLTKDEYVKTKEVIKSRKRINRKVIKRLRKIKPEYAQDYITLQTREEQIDYIEFLINHKFNVIGPGDLKYKEVIHFLKTFKFTVVSAKDVDRCAPISSELQKKYGDSIKFYLNATAFSGCEMQIYNITEQKKIDEVCCFLKEASDCYNTGTLKIFFFEKEVFEPAREADDASVVARDIENLIDEVIINYQDDLKRSR